MPLAAYEGLRVLERVLLLLERAPLFAAISTERELAAAPVLLTERLQLVEPSVLPADG